MFESGGEVLLEFCMMSRPCYVIVVDIQRSKGVTSCALISPACMLPVNVKQKIN